MKTKGTKKQENSSLTEQRLDEAVDKIEKRFKGTDKRFNAIDDRFSAIDNRFNAIDDRFNVIDDKFNAIDDRFNVIDDRFVELTKAFHNEMAHMSESIIERLERRMAEHTSRVLSVIDPFLKELEASRQERALSEREIPQVRNRLDDHEKRIRKLEHAKAN